MKRASIVISSLRQTKLEELIDSTEQYHDEIEVIVVSPFQPSPRGFVVHIPVPNINEPGELTFVQKFNLGFNNASGEFIVFVNDDYLFNETWLVEFLRFMEANKDARHPLLAAFRTRKNGKIHPGGPGDRGIFGFRYANYGGMSRDDFNKLGGAIFSDDFYMYYSDVDLGLRVWDQGGEVKVCDKVVLEDRGEDDAVHRGSVNRWFTHDERRLFYKWFHKYGKPARIKLAESEVHQLVRFVNSPMPWFETTDWQAELSTLIRKIELLGFLPYSARITLVRLQSITEKLCRPLLSRLGLLPYVSRIKQNLSSRWFHF